MKDSVNSASSDKEKLLMTEKLSTEKPQPSTTIQTLDNTANLTQNNEQNWSTENPATQSNQQKWSTETPVQLVMTTQRLEEDPITSTSINNNNSLSTDNILLSTKKSNNIENNTAGNIILLVDLYLK